MKSKHLDNRLPLIRSTSSEINFHINQIILTLAIPVLIINFLYFYLTRIHLSRSCSWEELHDKSIFEMWLLVSCRADSRGWLNYFLGVFYLSIYLSISAVRIFFTHWVKSGFLIHYSGGSNRLAKSHVARLLVGRK